MTNVEMADRIIYYFLKYNPGKKPEDFILEHQSLSHVTCFPWDKTKEGCNYWSELYDCVFNNDDSYVEDFLKDFYFNLDCNKFINLQLFL